MADDDSVLIRLRWTNISIATKVDLISIVNSTVRGLNLIFNNLELWNCHNAVFTLNLYTSIANNNIIPFTNFFLKYDTGKNKNNRSKINLAWNKFIPRIIVNNLLGTQWILYY